ncbi:GNAT family N-acetyltransferase [Inhella gelatinilytica]|uniref:GNAT family N-acetyltransferase n=1 Tax=Inhella gelatinilytica TaxID=2795030 RepID=A0A931IUQ9_9BURK|nr:GNAT family N-acetyltransferase [Inhella gelatinilytica]MBH9551354.1 GNAT family N-acetyltransferase [Inhella gelatinilytica]
MPELRRAVAADAPVLAALGAQVFLETYATDGVTPALAREVAEFFTTDRFLALMRDPTVELQVLAQGEGLLGFAQSQVDVTHRLVSTGRPAELQRLYLQRRCHGQGLGAQLLRAAEQGMAARGAGVLWLDAWVHNQHARAFYVRQGYDELGADVYRYEDAVHETRIYARRLAPQN